MDIAVVGGGINGLCSAWELARQGHRVELFERGRLLGETSGASTKLLHGGLRYLEHGELRLVREALAERAWWLANCPQHARPIALWLPIYAGRSRPGWQIKVGLWLYDRLAGTRNIAPHRWYGREAVLERCPGLKPDGLSGAFLFYDGQMDEQGLGGWVAEQVQAAGARLHTDRPVLRIAPDGLLTTGSGTGRFDRIVNAAGPWAVQLLESSGLVPKVRLDQVRGSHLIVERPQGAGFLLQVPGERRIFFVLPYRGRTLIGTTEVRQTLAEPIACSEDELNYLLRAYNAHFCEPLAPADVAETFAGLRPLIQSAADPGRATREYLIERTGALVNVYGGKWTTARALGRAVAAATARP
jgi:glycerol-3-phosphate dehydrogenase